MTIVDYLKRLPEGVYESEYERLKPIMCEEDVKELKINRMGEVTKLNWNTFESVTVWSVLVVEKHDESLKLVFWDCKLLTEEGSGKTYTWEHNPYKRWAAIL